MFDEQASSRITNRASNSNCMFTQNLESKPCSLLGQTTVRTSSITLPNTLDASSKYESAGKLWCSSLSSSQETVDIYNVWTVCSDRDVPERTCNAYHGISLKEILVFLSHHQVFWVSCEFCIQDETSSSIHLRNLEVTLVMTGS